MPTFKVPIKWECSGTYEIEADSKEEAIHLVQTVLPLPFPDDGAFIHDSARVIPDKIEEIKK